MKASKATGRIEAHGQGLGTSNSDLVEQRAREIAITNGRLASQFNEADLEQARQELLSPEPPSDPAIEDQPPNRKAGDGSPPVSLGHRADPSIPPDEQETIQELVEEGVEEAAHEQMVAGNQASRDSELED